MKTLFVTLFMSFAFLFPNESTTLVPPAEVNTEVADDAEKRTTVTIYTTFGRKRRNCRGFGICRVVVVVRSRSEKTGASATVVVDSGRARSMTFQKKSMSAETMKKYFSNGVFVVEEDISEKLKDNEGNGFLLELKAGKYKIEETKTGFNIGMPPTKK